MNYLAPGDGINSSLDRDDIPGRSYPSVDSLLSFNDNSNSDSFDEILIESENNLLADSVIGAGNLPRSRKYLFPKKEFVDHLQPEEVRWFYKKDTDKRWTAFVGYDSLRIECRFRVQQQHGVEGLTEAEIADLDLILVRGGMYEVDVPNGVCNPVYWSGDQSKIMRGTWFYGGTWQPIKAAYSTDIETKYLGTYLGHRINETASYTQKGPKPVVLTIRFAEFYLEWTSALDVYLFSETTTSRFMRAVGNKLGVAKSGSRVYRGYCVEAVMDDKPADITHLVFVVHGIGQKMDTGHIVHCCQELQDRIHYVRSKLFPSFEHQENQRAAFLPVEWRSSLKLDGDTVESLTPQRMRGIRVMLNASAMDILYYTSPLYRSEIIHSLENNLNRLYQMFCERHPYFEPNGGKVSIIAHSLGCVIAYDIITGWNPITLYDQYVSAVIDDERQQAGGSVDLIDELEKAKKRVADLETLLTDIHNKQIDAASRLKFKIENLFCLGSPLGVFLALRGIRPQAKGTLDHIIPKDSFKRLFNIYHPADPVAYRLEPLILKHYSTIRPLVIHRYDEPNKIPYTKMESTAFAAFMGSSEILDERERESSDKDSVISGSSAMSKDDCPAKKKTNLNKVNSTVNSWISSLTKSMGIQDGNMSAELKMLDKMQKEAEIYEKSSFTDIQKQTISMEEIDHTDLEYRLDYQLRDGGGLTSGYISMVTSHTSYWTNKDIACFLLTHLHSGLQDS